MISHAQPVDVPLPDLPQKHIFTATASVIPKSIHDKSCALHDTEHQKKCFGYTKRGVLCSSKASVPSFKNVMPTCKKHLGQRRLSAFCRELLPCGYECGTIFEWKPYGFHLCNKHQESNANQRCYLLGIPLEIRMHIYEYILPGLVVPARFNSNQPADFNQVSATILRVSRQIHDEAAEVLYGSKIFSIDILRAEISMCKMITKQPLYIFSTNENDLPEYQMQPRLTQIQNSNRVMMARQGQEQEPMTLQSSATTQSFSTTQTQLAFKSLGDTGPAWSMPLSMRYFKLIRSFRINIAGTSHVEKDSMMNPTLPLVTHPYLDKQVEQYDCCDNLHQVVGALQLLQGPLVRLELSFYFTLIENDHETAFAFSAAKLLLGPLKRLRNVGIAKVFSIMVDNMKIWRREIFKFPDASLDNDPYQQEFIKWHAQWSKDVCSSKAPVSFPVLDIFWKLKRFVGRLIAERPEAREFYRFNELLQEARTAREANDLITIQQVWEKVVDVWFEYTRSQKEFENSVTNEMKDIFTVVRGYSGPVESSSSKGKGTAYEFGNM